MKRIIGIMSLLLLSLTFIGCGQNEDVYESVYEYCGDYCYEENAGHHDEHYVHDYMASHIPIAFGFSSVEHFLVAVRLFQTGGSLEDFQAYGILTEFLHEDFDMELFQETRRFSASNDNVFDEVIGLFNAINLAGIDHFYLPLGIPENYVLHAVVVSEMHVIMRWFLEDDLASYLNLYYDVFDGWDRYFRFGMTRLDAGQHTLNLRNREVLINNDLAFDSIETLRWVSESRPMSLSFPRPTTFPEGHFQIPDGQDGYITFYSLEELTTLTTTFPVDLSDDDLVDFLIQHGMPPRELSFNLGGTSTSPTTPAYMPTVNVPQRAEILDFLIGDYSTLDTFAPTRLGYRLAGWYLDADFATRVDNTTRMPGHEVTLYARWESL